MFLNNQWINLYKRINKTFNIMPSNKGIVVENDSVIES